MIPRHFPPAPENPPTFTALIVDPGTKKARKRDGAEIAAIVVPWAVPALREVVAWGERNGGLDDLLAELFVEVPKYGAPTEASVMAIRRETSHARGTLPVYVMLVNADGLFEWSFDVPLSALEASR